MKIEEKDPRSFFARHSKIFEISGLVILTLVVLLILI